MALANYQAQPTAPALQLLRHKPGRAIKSVPRGNGLIEGYLIAWGTPVDRDLEGQWFTKATELCLDWFPNWPMLYHHGMDPTLGIATIGRIKSVNVDDIGLWTQAQLDMVNRYAQEVYNMVQLKQFGWSSGSIDHLVKIAKSGEILRWPLFEGSVTPTPAQPHKTTIRALKSVLPKNDPVSVYLGEHFYARAGDEAGANVYPVKSSSGDNLMFASPRTKRYVLKTLKQAGYAPTEDEVDAIAADLEEEQATMADGYDDPAMMGDFEDDPAMMGDFEDDPAMMGDFEDDPAMMMDDEEDYATASRKRWGGRPSRRPRRKSTKAYGGGYTQYLERRIKALERLEAPGERSRGMKSSSMRITDEADRPGAYKSVFTEYVRFGESHLNPTQKYIMKRGQTDLGPVDGEAIKSVKALNIGNAGSVGFGVPEDWIAELNKNVMVQAMTANECKVRETSSDRVKQPYLETNDARRAYSSGSVSWPGESPADAAATATDELALGQTEVPVHVMLINMPATLSSMEDLAFDLQAEITEFFGEAVAVEYENLIWRGNGQGKMSGITNDTRVVGTQSVGVQTVSGYVKSGEAAALSNPDVLKDIMMHMPPAYRQQAKWIANSNTINTISKMKDGNGNYVWGDEQGLNQGIPTTLMNRPIVYNEFADDVEADAYPLMYAFLGRGYMIAKRVEFAIKRFDDSAYAIRDQCLFIGRARVGGQVIRPEAIKVLKIAA